MFSCAASWFPDVELSGMLVFYEPLRTSVAFGMGSSTIPTLPALRMRHGARDGPAQVRHM
jgi:hypothetical protein